MDNAPSPTDPGLDSDRLAALRRPHPGTARLPARIREHLDVHDGYLAFSGGKDSLVVLHLALSVEPNITMVFFDRGSATSSTCTAGCACSCSGSPRGTQRWRC